MRDGYTKIQTYLNYLDAELARSHLEAMGLDALVRSDNCGGMRPHFDLTGGVFLLVPEADADRALALLDGLSRSTVTEPWDCPGCGENIEAGFDTCWNCGFTGS